LSHQRNPSAFGIDVHRYTCRYVDKCRHEEQGISYAWRATERRKFKAHGPSILISRTAGGASARDRASKKKRWERTDGVEGKKMRLILLILPAANTWESNGYVPAFKFDDPMKD